MLSIVAWFAGYVLLEHIHHLRRLGSFVEMWHCAHQSSTKNAGEVDNIFGKIADM